MKKIGLMNKMLDKKTLLFDIDGVLINVPRLYTQLSKKAHENILVHRLEMIDFFKTSIWRRAGTLRLKPIKNIQILRDLIADGHEVHLVSRRARETDLSLIDLWLERNDLTIPIENIHMRFFNVPDEKFLSEAEFKSLILTQTLADGFWDDKPEIVEHIKREYKESGRFGYDCPAHLFVGWEDVGRWVKENEKS